MPTLTQPDDEDEGAPPVNEAAVAVAVATLAVVVGTALAVNDDTSNGSSFDFSDFTTARSFRGDAQHLREYEYTGACSSAFARAVKSDVARVYACNKRLYEKHVMGRLRRWTALVLM